MTFIEEAGNEAVITRTLWENRKQNNDRSFPSAPSHQVIVGSDAPFVEEMGNEVVWQFEELYLETKTRKAERRSFSRLHQSSRLTSIEEMGNVVCLFVCYLFVCLFIVVLLVVVCLRGGVEGSNCEGTVTG